MSKRAQKRPTDAELEILRVIWNRGPSTVREVFTELQPTRDTGYTTVLKFMQIMTDKGLLRRDESVRPQVYAPARSQHQTQRQLIGERLSRQPRAPGALGQEDHGRGAEADPGAAR